MPDIEIAMADQPTDRFATCPIRGIQRCRVDVIGSFHDRSGKVGPLTVARCRDCGIGISRPPLADVAFLYVSRESQDFQPGTSGITRALKRVAFLQDARRLPAGVRPYPASVVDFGCGSGLFTRCLGDAAPAGTKVIGVDFHQQPPAELADRPYLPHTEADQLNGTVDLVLAMHVLEHDDTPANLLRRLISLVKADGHIIVEVPNIDCAWVAVFGRHWDSWYMPYHRVHFSRASLRSLFEENGLVVELEQDISIPSIGRTLANMLGRPNSSVFVMVSPVLQPLQWFVERVTRRPTALRLVARRRPYGSGQIPPHIGHQIDDALKTVITS